MSFSPYITVMFLIELLDFHENAGVEDFQSLSRVSGFNPFILYVPLGIVVWTYTIFDNNFGIGIDFAKYLKESCW